MEVQSLVMTSRRDRGRGGWVGVPVAPGGGEDRTVTRSTEATKPRTRQSRGTKHTADNFGSLAGKHIKDYVGRI